MSLINTLRQEIRVRYPNGADNEEWRFTRYGLIEAAKESTRDPMSVMGPETLARVNSSQGTPLKVTVIDNEPVTVGNVRSCVIADLENTSNLVEITFAQYVVDISMYPAQYRNNNIGRIQDFARKWQRAENALALAIENSIDTKLDTDASAIYNSSLIGTKYALAGAAIQVPLANQNLFYNDMDAIMKEDNFFDAPYMVVAATGHIPPVRNWANQGQANSMNTTFQFNNFMFRYSNQVSNGAGVASTAYVMPRGAMGIAFRNTIEGQEQMKSTTGTEWGEVRSDILGWDLSYSYKSECRDLSGVPGLSHLTNTLVENWQLSIEVALLTPYNSDPGAIPGAIKKVEFLEA